MDFDIGDLHSIAVEAVIFQSHHHPNYHLHQLTVSAMCSKTHRFCPKVPRDNLRCKLILI